MYVLKIKKHEKHAQKGVVKNCAYDNNKAKRMVNAVIRWVHANGHVGLMFDEEEKKEGNVLFHDALNTFYLRLYSEHHFVHSEKGNPLPPHGLLFPISSKGSFDMHHPTDRIAHTMVFVIPVVKHWLEREIAQWVHSMKDPMTHRTMSERSYHRATSRSTMKNRSDDPSHRERTLLPWSYVSLHHEGLI